MSYEGADVGRLAGGWNAWEQDPDDEWRSDATALAVRAQDLVHNDPVMAALKTAKLIGTHGSKGLIFRSLAEFDGKPAGGLRDQIEQEIQRASAGTNLDAQGQMCRRELEEGLDELATVTGESFAVKAWMPDRPGALTGTCWRLLRRDRVANPPGETDAENIFQGFTLSKDGAPDGAWIAPPKRYRFGATASPRAGWVRVPWHIDNEPAIIHRIGLRPAGSYRCLSMFAPNLAMARQTRRALEAYIVAKRIQACHPIFIVADDPVAAAAKDKNGAVWGPNTTMEPGKVYYLAPGSDVKFPSFSFQGADLKEFLDTIYRNQFAAWGMPIDVVLAQLGETNMAASRSAWLQYYRQCDRWQDDHISQVSRIIDRAIIAEAVALKRIILPPGMTLDEAMRGEYLRPPRAMPDPLKEAQAAKAWIELGRDKSSVFAESGIDFRQAVEQRSEDDRWQAELNAAGGEANPDAKFIARVAQIDSLTKTSGVDGLAWPIVVAARAAETAPGAFLAALAKQAEPAKPQEEQAPADQPAQPEDADGPARPDQ